MRLRIGIVFALGLLAWLFVVRPAARRVALADVYNRVNEDRCCTDGLRLSPNACGRALEELARTAPADQLEKCPHSASKNRATRHGASVAFSRPPRIAMARRRSSC